MASSEERNNVYLAYNDKNDDIKKLVEKLCKRYGNECTIQRYQEDFKIGAFVLDEMIRLSKEANVIIIIIDEKFSENPLYYFDTNQSLSSSIMDRTKRCVPIGVGIKEKNLHEKFKQFVYKVYETFSEVDVNNNAFLNKAFLSGPTEEKEDCISSPTRATREEGDGNSFPKTATEEEVDAKSLSKTTDEEGDANSLSKTATVEEGDANSLPTTATVEEGDANSLPTRPAEEKGDRSCLFKRFTRRTSTIMLAGAT